MPGIDELISKSLSKVINNELDPKLAKKVKMTLFKKHGISLLKGIKDFPKVDEVLKEFLELDSSSFEQKCLMKVLTLKNLKNLTVVTIKDKNLQNLFLEILGDKEYGRIIESTVSKPLLIKEIIDECQLSKTSGYRKINYLIHNGFLIEAKTEFTIKHRSITRYTTIFKKIGFELNENQKFVKLTIPAKTIKQSSSIQTILNL